MWPSMNWIPHIDEITALRLNRIFQQAFKFIPGHIVYNLAYNQIL